MYVWLIVGSILLINSVSQMLLFMDAQANYVYITKNDVSEIVRFFVNRLVHPM